MGNFVNILLYDITLPFDADEQEILQYAERKMKRAGIFTAPLHFRLYKKSFDARNKSDIKAVCSVLVSGEEGLEAKLAKTSLKYRVFDEPELAICYGKMPMPERPLVVGMGPAGLFAALLLAENGYRPILIDRGAGVEERVGDVETFYREKALDPESNIQFGAGGAGTFSDGKLVTRINDAKCGYVLARLHEFGAPADILVKARPHVGTDILRAVVAGLLARIEALGGEVIYHCRMESIRSLPDKTLSVKTSRGDMVCGALVLAIGHSSRDTYRTLLESGYALLPKPFSVGVRVEHRKEEIDRALYGALAGHPALGAGEYNLSYTKGARGVYTFCMCPGGEVVAAASELGGVVVNGMSHHARDGVNSNSAVAVSVKPEDYGNTVMGAIEYQRHLEREAFRHGGGNYAAPIQTMGDFMKGQLKHSPTDIQPTYMNGTHCKLARLDAILPAELTASLRQGFSMFDKSLAGFAKESAILSGFETRTSAPVRILRGEDLTALSQDLVYPCGEGAGYAGGITSAAIDGIKTALAILSRFSPF